MATLGRLAQVRPRDVWPHEAHDFTPWLLDNADVLGEVLGMDLELERAEHPVGDFSLDLLGRDLATGERVIVENQLEVSDHLHLGQILTYAAGTDPTSIVWVTPSFRPEHRAALDWLNTRTDESTRFFGVEIVVVRIGDSMPAPAFRLVAQPNDWEKTVRSTSAVAGRQVASAASYQAVWTRFMAAVEAQHPGWSRATRPPVGVSFGMTAGVRGATYYVSYFKRGVTSEIYFEHPDAAVNQAWWQYFYDRREALESAYGGPLEFLDMPNRKGARISDHLPGAVITDEQAWGEHLAWMLDRQARLRAAVASLGGVPDPASLL